MNEISEDSKDLFPIGCQVNVTYWAGDMFNHDFTGHVKGYHGPFVTVEDQDGDCFDCIPEQLEHSSDEIMHND